MPSNPQSSLYDVVLPWPRPHETEGFISHRQYDALDQQGWKHGDGHSSGGESHCSASRSRSGPSDLAWWTYEIFAMVISVTAFASIVTILSIYDGHAMSTLGLPTGLTLNAIIAALATVSRASLMVPIASVLVQELWLYFAKEAKKQTCSSRLRELNVFDIASRGSWGSLLLLYSINYKRVIASLAALITIFSLAFGTFIQQSLVTDKLVALSSEYSSHPGNVPRSEMWEQLEGNIAEGSWGPPLSMIASFYDGVLRGNITPPPPTCGSGNCTWPLTPSMAICGGCVSTKPVSTICYDEDKICNYTMPSGSVAQLWNFDNPQYGTDGDNVPGFQSIIGQGAYYRYSEGNRAYVANFDVAGAPYGSYASIHNNVLSASECALWMCVKTYKIAIVAGKLEQTVVSQADKIDARGILQLDGATALDSSFPPLPIAYDPKQTTNFKVSRIPLEALQSYLKTAIPGTVLLNLESQEYSSDLVHGIWNGASNIGPWIEDVAASLTAIVRTSNETARSEYDGTAYALGVQVRWLWMTLPFTLLLGGLLVLAVTIVRTGQSSVEAWKANLLTFLLLGIDEDLRDKAIGQSTKRNGFEEAMGDRKVRLVEESGSLWKFKSA